MPLYSLFIVRPFGIKGGFDFDLVESALIRPALAKLEARHGIRVTGGTTGEIVKQGNIRTDMFRQLVVSDLVIADVSIHNANVFYELGIRHGLQQRHTVLLRSEVDDKNSYPFDLQSDRYFLYDREKLADGVDRLAETLRLSLADPGKDSPVFQQLPKLRPHARSELIPAPADFQEEIARAVSTRDVGKLRLMAQELDGLEWRTEGLRLVGNAQFMLKANHGARVTFEALREVDPNDLLANQRLGTIYQRLSRTAPETDRADLLTRSDLAVKQALAAAGNGVDRAEAQALLGSNAKTRWIDECRAAAPASLARQALRSAHLQNALDAYLGAMRHRLDRHYPAINVLALLKIQAALAAAEPQVWQARFEGNDDAARALQQRTRTADRVAALLELALDRDPVVGRPADLDDWGKSSIAELVLLTRPDDEERVRAAYVGALSSADQFTVEATRRNLEVFQHLELFEPATSAALQEVASLHPAVDPPPPQRVVLFTGHMVDRLGRPHPRFPRTERAEQIAQQMIRKALEEESNLGPISLALAGGACGADILFHEAAAAAGIDHKVWLALPPDRFQVTSVQHGGPSWVERFSQLRATAAARVLQDAESMPLWLAEHGGYDVWQRNNLWMMFTALSLQASHLTLIALFNPVLDADGPGGTRHLLQEARKHQFKVVELDARELLG
ncbi:tetratricopeptide repeat-containing protein [Aquabacterium humicola]|uniref:tetratricopeptide repeat-containing protein n=1 Tax=Aquabacterium humicola TaxID=3237377 RepID=UPI002543A536|nr:tetratricopeptide repeat-containing protein [Rubrivivax pictus]